MKVQNSYDNEIKKLFAVKATSYQLCIQQIYQKRFTITDLYMMSDDLMVDITFGAQYSIIRDQLQSICKIHRRFIADSAKTLCMNKESYCSLAPDSKSKSQYSPSQLTQLKMKESVVWVLYHHYRNIAESNRLVCSFWEMMQNCKPKQKNEKNYQLKEHILNHLAIKQLVPSSQHINLHPIQSCLKQLLIAPPILKKQHILEMYKLFEEHQIFPKTQKKKVQIQDPYKGSKKMDEKLPDSWLERAKADKIGSKLSQLLGGRFSMFEQKNDLANSKRAYEEIKKQIIPKSTTIDFTLDNEQIQLVHIQKTIITAQIFDDTINIQETTEISKEKQCEQISEENTEKKKRKRKKKKKKKNDNQNNQIIQDKKQQEIMLVRKLSEQPKQYSSYIRKIRKMLEEATIDESRRIAIPKPHRSLEQWRIWAKENDPI